MNNIKKLVSTLLHKHETNDPFTLCDYLGIAVLYEDLANVRGIYQNHYRKKIIHINRKLEPHIQRQVCAHELGHALLHKKINTVLCDVHSNANTPCIELEANLFAAELLAEDERAE